MSVFDQARSAINMAVVSYVCDSPGAYWQNDEFWTRSPIRGDADIGSFSINSVGLWCDFATGEKGDLIDLLCLKNGYGKKQAAEEIVRISGGSVLPLGNEPPKAKKSDKIKAQIPVPETALKTLNQAINADWCTDRHGKPVKGWTYRDAHGHPVFAIVRFVKPDGSKDILPWYFGVDNRWHNGQALDHGRPLYKLDQIMAADTSVPILVVEGEKCASIDVPGYLVTTWAGGSAATAKTDWSPLEGRQVIIWPDADDAGAKAAAAIVNRLPSARVMTVSGKPKGWDIADAIKDGVDPVAFIAESLPSAVQGRPDDGLPFMVLGNDSGCHYFMRRDSRTIFPVARGKFGAISACEIAAKSYWAVDFSSKTGDGIRPVDIYDYLVGLSVAAGSYDQTKIRGAGVWRDASGIVLNDGTRLIFPDGSSKDFDAHKSEYVYIKSAVKFGTMSGPESTDDDGRSLEALFRAQSWADPAMAPLAMGWALIAPFGGMLRWRPHIWLTGRKGSGKSYMMEHLIAPLCGPFAHRGSGKDTEAGIRRSLNLDARPVILDEMEPKTPKAREKIASLLELARNASSDASGMITIGGGANGGSVSFVIRSCFAFASVQVPCDDAATASRIIKMELKVEKDQAAKFKRCASLYADCMGDPSRFTRRIYRALPRILHDTEWIRSEYLAAFQQQRRVDQIAPLLATAWAAQSTEKLQSSDEGKIWLEKWIFRLVDERYETVEDEDAVAYHLMSAQIRTDDQVQRTVAELLTVASTDGESSAAAKILSRHGIRIIQTDGKTALAVSINNQYIKKILSSTPYESDYGAQLRRSPYCIDDTRPVKFACGQSRACILDWSGFKDQYLEGQRELPENPPF